jgi:hypothetical protein
VEQTVFFFKFKDQGSTTIWQNINKTKLQGPGTIDHDDDRLEDVTIKDGQV